MNKKKKIEKDLTQYRKKLIKKNIFNDINIKFKKNLNFISKIKKKNIKNFDKIININFKYKNNKQRIEIFLNNFLKIKLNNNQKKNEYKIKCDLIGCGGYNSFIFGKKENELFLSKKDHPKPLVLDKDNIIEKFKLNFSRIKKISIGGYHILILFENNDLFSIGENVYGQCGINNENNENKNILVPKKIKFSDFLKIDKNKKIKDIYCNQYSSYILLDNELFSFGSNNYGQLGTGNNNTINSRMKDLSYNGSCSYFIPEKIKINLTNHVNEKIIEFFTSSISDYSFLLTKNDNIFKIYGFGSNTANELGIFYGKNDPIISPTIIDSLKNIKIKKIFCGFENTFVLGKNNKLFGFGRNQYGQLGIKKKNNEITKEIKEICFFNEKIKKISLNTSSTIFLTSFFYFLFFIFYFLNFYFLN